MCLCASAMLTGYLPVMAEEEMSAAPAPEGETQPAETLPAEPVPTAEAEEPAAPAEEPADTQFRTTEEAPDTQPAEETPKEAPADDPAPAPTEEPAAKSGWDGDTYWENGTQLFGLQIIGGSLYYLDPDDGGRKAISCSITLGDTEYSFGTDGVCTGQKDLSQKDEDKKDDKNDKYDSDKNDRDDEDDDGRIVIEDEDEEEEDQDELMKLPPDLDPDNMEIGVNKDTDKSVSFNVIDHGSDRVIVNRLIGRYNLLPDFSNSKAWRGSVSAYNTPGLWGQCTWFAWGRFYEIYGFDPGFTGNGYECARQLVANHGDLFRLSEKPAAGAVFSCDDRFNHTGVILEYDKETDMMTVSEGNLDGVSNPNWEEAINDYRTMTISQQDFLNLYGHTVYAVPRTSVWAEKRLNDVLSGSIDVEAEGTAAYNIVSIHRELEDVEIVEGESETTESAETDEIVEEEPAEEIDDEELEKSVSARAARAAEEEESAALMGEDSERIVIEDEPEETAEEKPEETEKPAADTTEKTTRTTTSEKTSDSEGEKAAEEPKTPSRPEQAASEDQPETKASEPAESQADEETAPAEESEEETIRAFHEELRNRAFDESGRKSTNGRIVKKAGLFAQALEKAAGRQSRSSVLAAVKTTTKAVPVNAKAAKARAQQATAQLGLSAASARGAFEERAEAATRTEN